MTPYADQTTTNHSKQNCFSLGPATKIVICSTSPAKTPLKRLNHWGYICSYQTSTKDLRSHRSVRSEGISVVTRHLPKA